jgi:uncharacterized coiled-coil DUF342 family protein
MVPLPPDPRDADLAALRAKLADALERARIDCDQADRVTEEAARMAEEVERLRAERDALRDALRSIANGTAWNARETALYALGEKESPLCLT